MGMTSPKSAGRVSRNPIKPPGQAGSGKPSRASSTDSTREAILAAAADSFAEQGFDRASMREIAQLSGITAGAIYSHFDSKAELLMEVVKRALESLPLSGDRLTGEEEPEHLTENAAIHTDSASRMLRRLSLEVHAAASRDKDVEALLVDYDDMIMDKLQKLIQRGQKSGKIDKTRDPLFTVRAVVVFIMGLSHLDTLFPKLIGDRSWRRFVEETMNNLLGLQDGDILKKSAPNSRNRDDRPKHRE
jgi:AcrR family transcriptional regulator